MRVLSEGFIMVLEDIDDQIVEVCSFLGFFCIYCNEDEVKWVCNDCFWEFCDRCKCIYLIVDEEIWDYYLYRYGSKCVFGLNVLDVIYYLEFFVNEVCLFRVKFKFVVESCVLEFKLKMLLVENSIV